MKNIKGDNIQWTMTEIPVEITQATKWSIDIGGTKGVEEALLNVKDALNAVVSAVSDLQIAIEDLGENAAANSKAKKKKNDNNKVLWT